MHFLEAVEPSLGDCERGESDNGIAELNIPDVRWVFVSERPVRKVELEDVRFTCKSPLSRPKLGVSTLRRGRDGVSVLRPVDVDGRMECELTGVVAVE